MAYIKAIGDKEMSENNKNLLKNMYDEGKAEIEQRQKEIMKKRDEI